MSISALQAQIAKLEALIAKAEAEIKVCEEAKKESIVIVEDASNCVKELNCVSSNLEKGLVIDGKPKGSGVAEMANNLTDFNKNMEANIQALTDQINALKRNIGQWQREIASLQAEIQRLIEEAERRNMAKAANEKFKSYQSGGF